MLINDPYPNNYAQKPISQDSYTDNSTTTTTSANTQAYVTQNVPTYSGTGWPTLSIPAMGDTEDDIVVKKKDGTEIRLVATLEKLEKENSELKNQVNQMTLGLGMMQEKVAEMMAAKTWYEKMSHSHDIKINKGKPVFSKKDVQACVSKSSQGTRSGISGLTKEKLDQLHQMYVRSSVGEEHERIKREIDKHVSTDWKN
jgi:hypothetical protein